MPFEMTGPVGVGETDWVEAVVDDAFFDVPVALDVELGGLELLEEVELEVLTRELLVGAELEALAAKLAATTDLVLTTGLLVAAAELFTGAGLVVGVKLEPDASADVEVLAAEDAPVVEFTAVVVVVVVVAADVVEGEDLDAGVVVESTVSPMRSSNSVCPEEEIVET